MVTNMDQNNNTTEENNETGEEFVLRIKTIMEDNPSKEFDSQKETDKDEKKSEEPLKKPSSCKDKTKCKKQNFLRKNFINNYFNDFNCNLSKLSEDNNLILKENYLSYLSIEEQMSIQQSYETLNVSHSSFKHIFSLFVYLSCFLSKDKIASFKNKLVEKNPDNKNIEICHQQVLTLGDKNGFIFHFMLNPFAFKSKVLNDFHIIRAYKNIKKFGEQKPKTIEENIDFLQNVIKPLFDDNVSDFVLLYMMNNDEKYYTPERIANEIKQTLGLDILIKYVNEDLIFESQYRPMLKQFKNFNESHSAYVKSLSIPKIKELGIVIHNNTIDKLYYNYSKKYLNCYKILAYYACNKLLCLNDFGESSFHTNTNDKYNAGVPLGTITTKEQLNIYKLHCFDRICSAKNIDEINSLQTFFEDNISKEIFFCLEDKSYKLEGYDFVDFIQFNYKKFNDENVFVELSHQFSISASLLFIYKLGMNDFKILDKTAKDDLFIFDHDIFQAKKYIIKSEINLLMRKTDYNMQDYVYCARLIDIFNYYYFTKLNDNDMFSYDDLICQLINLSQKMGLTRIIEYADQDDNYFKLEKDINIKSLKIEYLYGLSDSTFYEILDYQFIDIEVILQDNFNVKNISGFYYKKIRRSFSNRILKTMSLRNEKDAERILNIVAPNKINPDIHKKELLDILSLIVMFIKENKGNVKKSLIMKTVSVLENLSYLSVDLILSVLAKDNESHFLFNREEFSSNKNLSVFTPKYLDKINAGCFVYKIHEDYKDSEILDIHFIYPLLNINADINNHDEKLKDFNKTLSFFKNNIKTDGEIINDEKIPILDRNALIKVAPSEVVTQDNLFDYADQSNKFYFNYRPYDEQIRKLTEKYPLYQNLIEDMLISFDLKQKNKNIIQTPRMIVGEKIGLKDLMKDISDIIQHKTISIDLDDLSTQSDLIGTSPYWSNSDFGNIFKSTLNSTIINNIFLIENIFIQQSNDMSNYHQIDVDKLNFLFNDDRSFVDNKASTLELDMSYFYFIITAKDKKDVSAKYKKLKEITLNNDEANRVTTFKTTLLKYAKSLNKEKEIVIHDDFIQYLLNLDENLETKKMRSIEIINDDVYSDKPIILSIAKYEEKYSLDILKEDEIYIFSKKEILNRRDEFLKQRNNYGFDFCGNVINKGFAKKLILADNFLDEVQKINYEYPNFKEVTKYICDSYIVSKRLNKPFYVKPILLAGPPGIGKTHYSKRISGILNLAFHLISCEKIGSNYDIFGSNSVYTGAKEGLIAKFMLEEADNANPIIMFDEIDKIKNNHNVSDDFLLGILEKENSKNFKDLFLFLEIDLSHINIIGTANYLNNISDPIKSRFKIFDIDYLDHNERKTLLKYILVDTINDLGLVNIISSKISEEVEDKLINSFKSTRDIVKILHEILMSAASNNKNKIELIDLPDEINNKKPWNNIF